MKKVVISRKIGKYLIYVFVGILLVVLFIISDAKNRKHEFVFITFPKNQSIAYEDTSEINIYLYAREKRTMYLDPECISQTNLIDNITKDRYQLEQVEISESDEEIQYQKRRYFGYLVKALFPFATNDLLLIEDAYLEFTYQNGESLSLKVGSFAFDSLSINNEIRLTYLKGLTGSVGNYLSLASIIIEVTNDSDQDLTLDHLQFISPFIRVNYDHVTELSKDFARSNFQLVEVLSDYDLKKSGANSHFDMVIEGKSSKHLLIPLVYLKNTFINQVAFKLNYYFDTQEMQTITSPSFRYFTTKIEVVPPEQLIYVRN